MSCCGDEASKKAKKRNQEIERSMRGHRDTYKDESRILLLGAGGSGKSTFFRQMEMLHGEPYTAEFRITFRPIIYRNILDAMKCLIRACARFRVALDTPANRQAADEIYAFSFDPNSRTEGSQNLSPTEIFNVFVRDIMPQIRRLWQDNGIRSIFKRRNEYSIPESTQYFLDKLHRTSKRAPIEQMGSHQYLPTDDDILRARIKTIGIKEMAFRYEGKVFRITDVGGQRNERRKWIHCFDDVTAVIFMASLSGYNEVLEEDETQNRMREAMSLFEDICNLSYFDATAFILFLNKLDVFTQKLKV
ncbi:guanine nucleotide binding protein (G-protein), alpha subunit [Kipferlia bialata]|uniref:Guanine nucleotide binding protein (G-protein), alpha subunit n=1 Tax=Kipferlia bialata TaxID=797122 RepID=A0A9K3GL55_9EUKA|nr:guanine nucleotide binding protein (G-protein), alpha subunit [Kipferlia bialata]|eukprot:g8950.t1